MRSTVAALLVSSIVALPALAQDPIAVAPAMHKVTLDNERTRTYQVTIKKGAAIPLHSHPQHVISVIAGGKLEVTDKDGKVTVLDLQPGQTLFSEAVTHSAKNVGRTTIQAFVTELKEAAPSGALTDGEREQLLELYEDSREQLEALVASTPDELWAKKPGPDRWSVAEVVEHLALAEPLLFGFVERSLAAPADPNWALVAGAMPIDALIDRISDRSQKAKAPEPAQPKGGMSRADALAKYAGARQVTSEFVHRTDAPVKKHVAELPFGKNTAHQILVLIGAHNLRHNAQIAEALEQLRKK